MITCRVADISKSYGGTRALDHASFELREGITGLLGPNGAGKTTLLRILGTLLAPDEGRVELLGRNPARPAERLEVRRRLGYMPQEPGFHRNFTVFEFVDYVGILKEILDRRARHREVRRVVDLVGLTDRSSSKIKSLSGGMRRRVALAQALLGEPELLILDEPTAGLDPEQRLRFRDLISRIGEDRTVVVSTHQTEEVAALCSNVVVLDQGHKLFDGTPRELTTVAAGQVWLADSRDPDARLAWRTGEGMYRHIGGAPANADLLAPSIEDGYLLLIGDLDAVAESSAAPRRSSGRGPGRRPASPRN